MKRDKETWAKVFTDGTTKHIYGFRYAQRQADRPAKAGERQGIVKKRLAAFAGTVRRLVLQSLCRHSRFEQLHYPHISWGEEGHPSWRHGRLVIHICQDCAKVIVRQNIGLCVKTHSNQHKKEEEQ